MTGMTRLSVWWTIPSALLCLASLTHAEIDSGRHSDGSTTRMTDLRNGIGMISEPHATQNPRPSGFDQKRVNTQSYQDPGAVTIFGSPSPPNHLTPAPVL